MGVLYDMCQEIVNVIDARELDKFRTRGAINMSTGFMITLVHEDDPDDPERIAALRKAAMEVLGLRL